MSNLNSVNSSMLLKSLNSVEKAKYAEFLFNAFSTLAKTARNDERFWKKITPSAIGAHSTIHQLLRQAYFRAVKLGVDGVKPHTRKLNFDDRVVSDVRYSPQDKLEILVNYFSDLLRSFQSLSEVSPGVELALIKLRAIQERFRRRLEANKSFAENHGNELDFTTHSNLAVALPTHKTKTGAEGKIVKLLAINSRVSAEAIRFLISFLDEVCVDIQAFIKDKVLPPDSKEAVGNCWLVLKHLVLQNSVELGVDRGLDPDFYTPKIKKFELLDEKQRALFWSFVFRGTEYMLKKIKLPQYVLNPSYVEVRKQLLEWNRVAQQQYQPLREVFKSLRKFNIQSRSYNEPSASGHFVPNLSQG